MEASNESFGKLNNFKGEFDVEKANIENHHFVIKDERYIWCRNWQMFNSTIPSGILKRHRNIYNNNPQKNERPRESIGSRGSRQAKGPTDQLLTINVSGIRFQTWQSTLQRFPDSLLGSADSMREFYDDKRREYFLDRDPYLFKFVLNFYRFGKLHCSQEDCPAAFEEELQFYGFSIYDVGDCCWEYCTPRQRSVLIENNDDALEGETITYDGNLCELHCEPKLTLRQKIWQTIGPSKTTKTGVIFHIIYGFFIFISVLIASLETLHCDGNKTCGEVHQEIFFTIESVCVVVFTVEFLVRFYVCPQKKNFFLNAMNVIDTLAILPYYITLIVTSFGADPSYIQILKVLRVIRILKLTRNSRRLRCLLLTLRRCAVDIVFLYCICFLAIILFGTAVYYLEMMEGEPTFSSIPESFWYICVTLMTVGYGDVVPSSVLGKLVGSVCCVSGVVLLALPIPILQEKQVPCTLESVTSRKRKRLENTVKCACCLEEMRRTQETEITEISDKSKELENGDVAREYNRM